MVKCCAPNCASTYQKGFRFFCFPTNQERRKEWIFNCQRDSWEPTRSSRLCELHFEYDQYENHRKDGLKKLRPFAVPTIFDVPKGKRRLLKRYRTETPKIYKPNVVVGFPPHVDHSYATKKSPPPVQDHFPDQTISFCEETAPNDDVSLPTITEIECARCKNFTSENRRLKYKIKMLQNSLENLKNNMKNVFYEDQIRCMTFKKKQANKWDDTTIKTAFQIYTVCGKKGYELLLNLNWPLPTLRIVNARLSGIRSAEEKQTKLIADDPMSD